MEHLLTFFKTRLGSIIIAVAILVAIPGFYFYNQYQKTQALLQNPAAAQQEEVKQLVAKVGKLMVLPQNETPTVATVSDKNKLKDQPFFQKAENGDKLLIYAKAAKAILYRPSVNKIIEVIAINATAPNQSSQTTQETSPKPTTEAKKLNIVVYNGTEVAGLAGETATRVKGKYPNVEITNTGNAAKTDYTKTLVIDVTGKNKTFSAELAKFLNGEVAKLPSDETKPASDLLIIVGNGE